MQTIEQMMEQYHQRPGHWDRGDSNTGLVSLNDRTYAKAAQPLLIPYLAREFFRENLHLTLDESVHSVVVLALVGSGYYAVSIIKNTPVFSAEVRSWAEKAYFALMLHTGRDVVKYRRVSQQWWKDNAKHFEAKDYAAVKPGAPLVSAFIEPKPPAPEDATRHAKAGTEPHRTSAATAGAPSAEPAPAPSTSSPLIYFLAIGSSLLLLAATVFFLRRKNPGEAFCVVIRREGGAGGIVIRGFPPVAHSWRETMFSKLDARRIVSPYNFELSPRAIRC